MKFQKAPRRTAEWGRVSSATYVVDCRSCGKWFTGTWERLQERMEAHERGHLRGNHQQGPRMRW